MLGEVASYDLLIHNYTIILEREREFMQFMEEILLKLGMETNNTMLCLCPFFNACVNYK